jgi:hypothetical protein
MPLCKTADIGGNYTLATTMGDLVVYSNFFDEPNWMYNSEIKKRFSELSEDCQNWLLELAKQPFKHISDENPLTRKLTKFYYELTYTGIHCYSSWNSGIDINDVRYYLVNEGIATLK